MATTRGCQPEVWQRHIEDCATPQVATLGAKRAEAYFAIPFYISDENRKCKMIYLRMAKLLARVSTGLESFDRVIDGLRTGDNVVWQVDKIEDYLFFVSHYVRRALSENKRVVYMRFAQHKPLVEANDKVAVYQLDASSGFESFSTQVYNIATRKERAFITSLILSRTSCRHGPPTS